MKIYLIKDYYMSKDAAELQQKLISPLGYKNTVSTSK